jgi:hypothetical protein
MNWEAIGAIAELLGAIGVIASLVYLATQIRQSREQMERNTRAMQAASFQQFDQTLHDAFTHVLSVPGLSRISRLGLADYGQLDEEDAYLFNMWIWAIMQRIDNAYYQYRVGMLDDDSWRTLLRILEGYKTNPGFSQWWWSGAKHSLSTEFVALVEEILGEEPDRGE